MESQEIGPYLGALEKGDSEGDFGGYWTGGEPGEPGWIPPEEEFETSQIFAEPEEEIIEAAPPKRGGGFRGGLKKAKTWWEAERTQRRTSKFINLVRNVEQKKKEVEYEKLKAWKREYKHKYGPKIGEKVWKTYKGILGPTKPVSKHWYIPAAMEEYYVPGARVRALTTPPMQGSPIAEVNRPNLAMLKRSSSPPPLTSIKVPRLRNIERQEGLGPAMGKLRQLGQFPKVDWAVYSEIHANGDADTPSNVRSKVGMLGFSRKEIDDSLKRLRNLGIIAPTGLVYNGEKELEIVGEEHNQALEKREMGLR